jgi:hypothetical protein
VPVFSIRSPQGVVIHIQAPDQQTAMQGAQQWAQQNAGYLSARANANQNIAQQNGGLGPVGGAINSAAHAATFGALSDIGGAVNAARNGVQNFAAGMGIGKNTGSSMSDAYKGYVDADRAASQDYAQQHPVANFASQMVGGSIAPGAAAGGRFIQAAPNIAGTIARSGAVGAAMGAASGFGNAQGNPVQRLPAAAQGAAAGGALGAAIPAGLAAAQPVVGGMADAASNLANNLGRRVGAVAPEVTANQQLARAILADGHTPDTLATAGANFPGASTPTVADLAGENTRAAIRNAATQGPARNAAQDYRNQVAANLQDNAIRLTGNLTPGETRTPLQLQSDLRDQQSAAAGAQYPAFQGTAVPVTDGLRSALSGASGSGAIGYAARLADALRDGTATGELGALRAANAPPGAGPDLGGEVDPNALAWARTVLGQPAPDSIQPTVSAGTLDVLRRGLRESAGQASRAGENGIASGLGARAGDIEGALSSVPGWDTARGTFRNYAQQIDAVDHGSTGLTATPPDFAAGIQPMTPEAQTASGVGYRQALANALGAPTENAVGALNRISTSTNQGQNLASQFGQDTADTYRAGLGAEADRMTNANYMAPNSNSATAGRQADAHSFSIHGALDALKGLLNGPDLTDAERSAIVSTGLSATPTDPLVAALLRAQQGGLNITGLAPLTVPAAAQQIALPNN